MLTRRTMTVMFLCIPAFMFGLTHGVGAAEDAAQKQAGEYTIHEWGVFPVARGDRWAKRSMLAEWSQMPVFFHGVLPDRKLQYFGPVYKPVVFFHGNKAQGVQLKITFAEGRPLVWWPPAASPADFGGVPLGKEPTNELHFSLLLNESPVGEKGIESFEVPDGHWVQMLRQVKATPIYVANTSGHRGFVTYVREPFVYYDGVIKALPSPTVSRDGSDILVHSDSPDDWLDVLAIERINGRVRVASQWLDRVPAGRRTTRIAMKDVTADEKKVGEGLAGELTKRLVAAKLKEDEAGALVTIWREGLFEREGLLLFYRMPQKAYDRLLPLEARPKPKEVVRVGLVMHERLEPEFPATVEKLIRQLGTGQREAAHTALMRLGGPAFPSIEAAVNDKNAEIARRCREILKELDAKQLVRPTK